ELAKDRPPHGGDLEDAAADGDPAARQALEQAAGALVTGLRAVAAALDPDVIVLGGGLIRPASRLFELVAAGWERAHLPWTEATLECARLGDEAGLLGAALLFSEQGSGRGPRGLA
ncbi:MAG: transcriptional regulator protein, partial [Acidimicrobiaceae bacterium]|nr:transcriptional regulator protein [Acidimicrobiaceae bacterium]